MQSEASASTVTSSPAAQPHIVDPHLAVPQDRQLLDRRDPQAVVGAGEEVPGERYHPGPAGGLPISGIGDPAHEDASSAVVGQRLGAGQHGAEPTELTVAFRNEPLALVAADVVLAFPVGAVGVHQQHVPVAEGEEVAARAVLLFRGPAPLRAVERADVLPVREVARLEQAGAVALVAGTEVLVADQRVEGVALLPAARIEDHALGKRGRELALAALTRIERDHRVLRQRHPAVELVVEALVDADAPARHVGDDGGHLHPAHGVAAVEVVAPGAGQGLAQRSRVVAPVHQVAAGDVLPAREVAFAGRVADLLQVADVVAPLPEQHAIQVVPPALRRHEVVARPVLVGHQLLAQLVGVHQQIVVTVHSLLLANRPGRVAQLGTGQALPSLSGCAIGWRSSREIMLVGIMLMDIIPG